MAYKNIVEKYLRYMKSKNFLSGEEQIILESALVDCPPELDYKAVYERYCKDKTIMIPVSYWDSDERKLI